MSSAPVSTRGVRALGAVRFAVGVALLAAPRIIGRSDDPSFQLLMRTIGVRDSVLGAGAVLAPERSASHWGGAGLASDSLDVLVGAASIRSVGRGGGLVATLLPVPFAAAGAWTLRRARR
ncbi:hypothetical protein ASE01_23290 [Nocardioides sp. Root190]|uniref:hypothetical protein n=1 Tax=Nocardioides sp. Root190 TaxID=1736488 RepID=UPI0006FCB08C|nr:hypothetical protein [Nocardioides sp. Root190]KRB79653.1 hypothetical protein ASE01_23290 [Nocardioides sp. Root190]